MHPQIIKEGNVEEQQFIKRLTQIFQHIESETKKVQERQQQENYIRKRKLEERERNKFLFEQWREIKIRQRNKPLQKNKFY